MTDIGGKCRGAGLGGVPAIGLVGGWSFPADMFAPLVSRLSSAGVSCHDWQGFADAWLGESPRDSVAGGTWLGWSLGGGLLLEAIARGRIRPDRLVLVSATPRFLAADGWPGVASGEWRALRRTTVANARSAACGFRQHFRLPDCHALPPGMSADVEGLDWLGAIDQRELLGGLTIPVEVWLAPGDPLIPPRWIDHLSLARSVTCRILPGSGHGAIFDAWDDLARTLDAGAV
ncbi:hypothetical protein [Guyparkeria sp.]|uniref:hypothetical protein n=1 Tax=Guyparkeria sp. TaxID=2035736 RepID=UPI003970DCC8